MRKSPSSENAKTTYLQRIGKKSIVSFFLLFMIWVGAYEQSNKDPEDSAFPKTISLAGSWQFQLDPQNRGVRDRWFAESFSDQILLPGTTDENRKGKENTKSEIKSLTRVFPYYGAAWYQHEIEIPEDWKGKNIFFSMERTKTSSLWVDGHFVGTQNSLTTPHRYDLSRLASPGKHLITLCINNLDIPPIGEPHQISDHTQTNWNGILGRIELQARDKAYMTDVQAYPDVKQRKIKLRIHFNTKCAGDLLLSLDPQNSATLHPVVSERKDLSISGDNYYETSISLDDSMQVWDEFTPDLYRLKIDFNGIVNHMPVHDSRQLQVGMRQFGTVHHQFQVNGQTIFLRGKHDACVFPLTGYAPMDTEKWVNIFRIAKSYGINHYRFHTWCPPEAAFEAADIVGIYLQPELPIWESIGRRSTNKRGSIEDPAADSISDARIQFIVDEGLRILQAYGNHPSFCMFALGNELSGNRNTMASIIEQFRKADPRHLYAQGSNNFLWEPQLSAGDDYWTTMMTGGHYRAGYFFPDTRGREVRGSYAVHTAGHINNVYPGTMIDYSSAISGIPVPVIGHEVGQYQVYPNFHEIKKYTGVLRARNFEIFKERLEAAGMQDQADDFMKASGALSVLCYREEIEAALRTPGFGGFQLLDLQDFPGQGTALVGILDAFMESKGLIEPDEWRHFCNDVVPLVKMAKYVWTDNETFTAEIKLANYSNHQFPHVALEWQLMDGNKHLVQAGESYPKDGETGNLVDYGTVQIDLRKIKGPEKLSLRLFLKGTAYQNCYPLWVYAHEIDTKPPAGITIAGTFDAEVINQLKKGHKVLLLPDDSSVALSVPGAFQSDFWCYPMFKKYNPPGTLGILCNPKDPALQNFPTEFHSNWQWWTLLKKGCAMILDDTPEEFRPIVQVIDNFERNHKLGVLFECKVGSGKLMVCSCNLMK